MVIFIVVEERECQSRWMRLRERYTREKNREKKKQLLEVEHLNENRLNFLKTCNSWNDLLKEEGITVCLKCFYS